MEAEETGGDSSSFNPNLKNLLLFAAASSSVDQASLSTCSSLCSGFHATPSNTQLHLASVASGSVAGQNSCSDDSGCLVHTTNSSLSDSSRVFLNCKHEFELVESDGEVSQFDSLDNSEGGMSAENFNTLKKGPLVAPIEPPPEFQDSPHTTMIRRSQLVDHKGYDDFAQVLLKDILGEAFLSILQHSKEERAASEHTYHILRRTRAISASDPQLNVTRSQLPSPPPTAITMENIYDEPSDSTRNSDDIEVDYYISKQLSASLARKKSSTLSANSQRLSSLTHTMRPNSRNSLQSRLSSSHNSLATLGGRCKVVDDTSFITQAMSHDPLMTRQSIIDFYNVPLDSDIYALPVDMVKADGAEVQVEVEQNPRRGVNNGDRSRRIRGSVNSGVAGTGVGKTSGEAKRRLFRRATGANNERMSGVGGTKLGAQNKSSSVSQSQLAVTNGVIAVGGHSTSTSGYSLGVNGTGVKRYSAPDGLVGNMEPVKCNSSSNSNLTSNANKKRGKRRNSQQGQGHSERQGVRQTQVALVTSDSSDEAQDGGTGGGSAVQLSGSSVGAEDQKDKEVLERKKGTKKKEGKRSNSREKSGGTSKQLTITLSKTLTKATGGGGGSGGNKEKKGSMPQSSSFTSQSSIQSNGGQAAGTGEKEKQAGAGTTKRESRDATKRGHNQFSTNLKQKFCSIFRIRNKSSVQLSEYEYNGNYTVAAGSPSASNSSAVGNSANGNGSSRSGSNNTAQRRARIMLRALPPLPKRAPPEVPVENGGSSGELNRRRPPAELPPESPPGVEIDSNNNDVSSAAGDVSSGEHETGRVDFASNLETIKQYGWYWGPISCQAAEKILSNEPDGSFIVRDSSDDHYIFSLTFKLNNCVRHVRIEQDKGTFSFGTLAKFKARTIVEFIEQALEYSRSGRYLFFLHRRPEHGPMRVQLKNPVSRFKHIQSLQHMCRFVIMKAIVRKDLISALPLPNRLKDYLSYKNCYTEHFIEDGNGEGETGQEGSTEGAEGITGANEESRVGAGEEENDRGEMQ